MHPLAIAGAIWIIVILFSRLVEAVHRNALSDLGAVEESETDSRELLRRENYHKRRAKVTVKRMAARISNKLIR